MTLAVLLVPGSLVAGSLVVGLVIWIGLPRRTVRPVFGCVVLVGFLVAIGLGFITYLGCAVG